MFLGSDVQFPDIVVRHRGPAPLSNGGSPGLLLRHKSHVAIGIAEKRVSHPLNWLELCIFVKGVRSGATLIQKAMQ